jgi:hypothetical protein
MGTTETTCTGDFTINPHLPTTCRLNVVWVRGAKPNPVPSPLDVVVNNGTGRVVATAVKPPTADYTGDVSADGKKYTLTRRGTGPLSPDGPAGPSLSWVRVDPALAVAIVLGKRHDVVGAV